MALTVNMPQLGESVTEGTIAKWLKQPGEFVAKYESIAEVVTDKVNAEIPSPADGSMGEHIATEGTTIAVGQPICTIETVEQAQQRSAWAQPTLESGSDPEPAPAAEAEPPTSEAPSVIQPDVQVEPEAGEIAAAADIAATAQPGPGSEPAPIIAGAAHAAGATADGESAGAATAGTQPSVDISTLHLTPAVRMLAREHAVDLGQIPGSGMGGRITKKDVLEFVQQRDSRPATAASPEAPPAPAPPAPAPAPQSVENSVPPATSPAAHEAPAHAGAAPAVHAETTQSAMEGTDVLVSLTPMRKAIAEHMVRSKQVSPHAWLMMETDMTQVARLRLARREEFEKRTGSRLTFLPFVARAVCEALREYPSLNASWSEEGVVEKGDIHLGIAVALEDNLIVPVIRNADRLTMAGMATSMADLAERGRQNKLKLDEITGGTFTLNNTGALGTVLTAPIINQPQAAILAMDMIVKRPVVVEGDAIAVRSMMNICLSFDHRINDGLQAARFLRAVKQKLEQIDDSTML